MIRNYFEYGHLGVNISEVLYFLWPAELLAAFQNLEVGNLKGRSLPYAEQVSIK